MHSIFHKKYLQPSEEIDEKAEIKTSDMCPEMQEDAITFAIQVSSMYLNWYFYDFGLITLPM